MTGEKSIVRVTSGVETVYLQGLRSMLVQLGIG